MSWGTRAGTGAALGELGKGLMQFTQFNIEDMRQKNLEAIRQQERGEDRALRAGERAEDLARDDSRHKDTLAEREKDRVAAAADRKAAREAAAAQAAEQRRQNRLERADKLLASELSPYTSKAADLQDQIADMQKLVNKGEGDPAMLADLEDRLAVVSVNAGKVRKQFIKDNPWYTDGAVIGGGLAQPVAEPAAETATPEPAAAATPGPWKNPPPASVTTQLNNGKPQTTGDAVGAVDGFVEEQFVKPFAAGDAAIPMAAAPEPAKPVTGGATAPAPKYAGKPGLQPRAKTADDALDMIGVTRSKSIPESVGEGVSDAADAVVDTAKAGAEKAAGAAVVVAKSVDEKRTQAGIGYGRAASGIQAKAKKFVDDSGKANARYATTYLMKGIRSGKAGPDADRFLESLAESGATNEEVRKYAEQAGYTKPYIEKLILAMNAIR